MKRIPEIEGSIKALQPKLEIDARDWTKTEKEHIEKCYHAITKESVGWGRTVDLGCEECVNSAVNIIKNYLNLVKDQPKTIEGGPEWTATLKTVQAKADELNFEFTKEQKTKDLKIAALKAFIDKLAATEPETGATAQASELDAEDDDLLGEEEYTREQLEAIVLAKTGEEVPAETSTEDLLEYVKDLENGENPSANA